MLLFFKYELVIGFKLGYKTAMHLLLNHVPFFMPKYKSVATPPKSKKLLPVNNQLGLTNVIKQE